MHQNKTVLFSCCSIDNQIVIELEDEYAIMNVHLVSHKGFWNRVLVAIKYIFGYKSKYGNWDQFLIDESHTDQLQSIIDNIKNK